MPGDLIESLLSMKMDIYRQIELQDKDTGALKRQWMYYKTIPCSAKGIVSNSTSTRANDRQVMDNRYSNQQFLQIRTLHKLSTREKITNITDKNSNVIWKELDFPTETPTVFEVVGVTPITDPYGEIIAYNSTIKRSENQQIGI